MDEKNGCGNPIIVINVIVTVVTDLLKFGNEVPGEIHVGNIAEERDIVYQKTVLMKKDFLFNVWWKLIS
jgi:hypothetical protein